MCCLLGELHVADTLDDKIRTNAEGPAKVSGDAGSIEQHKLIGRRYLLSRLLRSMIDFRRLRVASVFEGDHPRSRSSRENSHGGRS